MPSIASTNPLSPSFSKFALPRKQVRVFTLSIFFHTDLQKKTHFCFAHYLKPARVMAVSEFCCSVLQWLLQCVAMVVAVSCNGFCSEKKKRIVVLLII